VVCIGIATIDAVVAVEAIPAADERVPALDGRLAGGGVAATAAVTLARLGVPAAFIGRVAEDQAGRWIRDDLGAAGVDVAGLRMSAGRSPVSTALVQGGSRTRALAPFLGDLPALRLAESDLEACARAAWIHLDHLGIETMSAIRDAGITTPISFDAGVSTRAPLAGVTMFAPTAEALLTRYPGRSLDDALRDALAEGPRLVVATRGSQGSVAIERGADGPVIHAAPAFDVPSAGGSTLGAGDVFHGALLAALLDGRPIAEALRWANAAAALSCRALDGRSAIPDRTELLAFLASNAGASAAASSQVVPEVARHA
jgi:sugar/nucleoside kinase (ribokinase family)